ncbi:MAG: radical SAM protein [Candidatus Woesearchaeota archaeon]
MKISNYTNSLKSMALARLGKKTPIKVIHYITSSCNLHCGFCLAEELKREHDLTTIEIKRCMNEFKAAGTQVWDFEGGEPLLRRDIDEIIEHACKLGFVVTITTNGILVDKHIKALRKADFINISVDGPREIHNKIRGANCFDTIIKNIDELVNNGIRPTINMVVCKENLREMDYMVKLAIEHKCKIDFSLVVANLEHIEPYTLTKEEVEKAVRKILELKAKHPKTVNCSPSYLRRIVKYYNREIKRFIPKCLAGTAFCSISPSGEVALCVERLKESINGRKIGYNKAFQKLKNPGCDCTWRCFYNLSQMYSLKPLTLVRVGYNTLRGRWVHS